MGFLQRLFGRRKGPGSTGDPEKLYQDALELFGKERFREAADALEELARFDPGSATTQFTLGATYSRIAGEYEEDEETMRSWVEKSSRAFGEAVNLARQYGGLNDQQLAMARDASTAFDRLMERDRPSLPEDQRKTIYADYVETKDSELLLGTSLVQDVGAASRGPAASLAQMMEAVQGNAAKAEEAAVGKITQKYGITRGQLMAIEEEGKEKKWPFRAVGR
jgi:tetratricopeptide (TPR) repeat protein